MALHGIHFLLTYRCTSSCGHCFVWGSPDQQGTFTLEGVRAVLAQARALGTIEWIYFEGGEPFLFYPILVAGVREAAALGFQVGVVTNGFWATALEDAAAWLQPLAGSLQQLSVSTDLFHADERISHESEFATAAAAQLGIPSDTMICDQPEPTRDPAHPEAGEVFTGGDVMYRGRAVAELAGKARGRSWTSFRECPCERLDDPGRVHVDPLGFAHLCQGLVMGNLFQRPLDDLVSGYRPREHPIVGPLLEGGPAELVREFALPHRKAYADACHLCYEARLALRPRFPEWLAPGQMYGEGLT